MVGNPCAQRRTEANRSKTQLVGQWLQSDAVVKRCSNTNNFILNSGKVPQFKRHVRL